MKEKINQLFQDIENISKNFEQKPDLGIALLLKENFDKNNLNTPNHYLTVIEEMKALIQQSRILFLQSVLNKVCKEEGKVYDFEQPFESAMNYTAVVKKEEIYYLRDEDGDFREIFTSEEFVSFIDDLYWELYE
jgi:hypothetical protein